MLSGLSVSNALRKKPARKALDVEPLSRCVSETVALCVAISSPTGNPGTFAPAIDRGSVFELEAWA